jgi:SAM-dependent methyltransferase
METPIATGSEASSGREFPECRLCSAPLTQTFVDLGASPLANSYLEPAQLADGEMFYPLHVRVCAECLLVQLPELASPTEIFSDYAYFSSYSDSWVDHARRYVDLVAERFRLDQGSSVVEVASNDGYLLQFFQSRGVPVLGVEPAGNVAGAAQERGIPTVVDFFGQRLADRLAAEGHAADLIVGNNVLAHVPDVHDFVEGLRRLLKPNGVITMEFPHLLRLVEERQFDTIYHEHFSYFSFLTARKVLSAHGLEVFDVDELSTHGGSLRLYAQRRSSGRQAVCPSVETLLERERARGFDTLEGHAGFSARVEETKWRLLEFLIECRRQGKRVAGYGGPGKGNTLLNYCGIRTDLLEFTVDRNPYKQGQFLPGTHIPIRHPEALEHARPDFILILPWNLKEEIVAQLSYTREWGARCVVPIPEVEVL